MCGGGHKQTALQALIHQIGNNSPLIFSVFLCILHRRVPIMLNYEPHFHFASKISENTEKLEALAGIVLYSWN